MVEIHVPKADPITNNEAVPDTIIHINEKLPEMGALKLDELVDFYRDVADKMYNALKNSLPQAAMHYLACRLLENSRNLYRGI